MYLYSFLSTVLNQVLYLLKQYLWCRNSDGQCFDIPAVDVDPEIIRHRNQNTHILCGVSQIIPMYVRIDEHAQK
jgi:hypothetical protein